MVSLGVDDRDGESETSELMNQRYIRRISYGCSAWISNRSLWTEGVSPDCINRGIVLRSSGSLISAGLSAAGYFSFALILEKANPDTPYIHLWLTLAYFLIGGATVGSYFAALTCGKLSPLSLNLHANNPASLSFPSHPTLSLSVPLSLISLSSLVLSSFSSLNIFQSSTGDLNPISFLTFLGILSLTLNLFSALFLRILPTPIALPLETPEVDEEESLMSPTSQLLHLDEHTPLIIGGPEAAREDAEEIVRGKERWTVGRLMVDWGGFWGFGILLALCIGPVSVSFFKIFRRRQK